MCGERVDNKYRMTELRDREQSEGWRQRRKITCLAVSSIVFDV